MVIGIAVKRMTDVVDAAFGAGVDGGGAAELRKVLATRLGFQWIGNGSRGNESVEAFASRYSMVETS